MNNNQELFDAVCVGNVEVKYAKRIVIDEGHRVVIGKREEEKLIGRNWYTTIMIEDESCEEPDEEGNKIRKIRSEHATLANDPIISRAHATIEFKNGIATIADETSTNGTWVNREQVDFRQKIELNQGDMIKFGGDKYPISYFVEYNPYGEKGGELILSRCDDLVDRNCIEA